MMRLLSDRDAGVAVPWWWGYAWKRYETRETVLLPIPLNWIAGTLRQWWLRLREGPRSKVEQAIRQEIQEERDGKWAMGYQDSRKAGWAEIMRQHEIIIQGGWIPRTEKEP